MRIIKKLTELIEEELCDAEKYARLALEKKESYPEIAEIFNSLSAEELKHMNILHGAVAKLISTHSADGDPRTEGMKLAHEILHERAIEKEKEVRILQAMFRE